jgi:hypothetical protein
MKSRGATALDSLARTPTENAPTELTMNVFNPKPI